LPQERCARMHRKSRRIDRIEGKGGRPKEEKKLLRVDEVKSLVIKTRGLSSGGGAGRKSRKRGRHTQKKD